ncbi:MAG: alpha/beta hydrolase [Ferruginibacter sp.]|nr:alpha/beta hydrolase [Ferruginibacter sp.]
MKTIYCISGLGADEKAFSKLHIEGFQLKVIDWIEPLKNEPLANYATRMLQYIDEKNPILMGLSFGGIMCIEIAKQIPIQKIILISSIKTKYELPLWMKLVAKTRLHKIYSMKSYKITQPIQNLFLGATSADEKAMANNYRKNANTGYVKWAVNHILNWQNQQVAAPIFHIHGSADKMFPVKKVKADAIITNGKHLMVMTKANEVSIAIKQFLD